MKIDWGSFLLKRTPEKGPIFPLGSRVYYGFQGNGKSLSMVKYAFDIKRAFPESVIFSNMLLYGIDYHFLENDNDVAKALKFSNGQKGVLILLDEAHLYFNKKTGISLDVLTAISQQRKDRRRIVFSTQIWEELDISLRKQVKEIVKCKRFLNMIIMTVSNGETLHYDKLEGNYVADKMWTEIYKMNDRYYKRYNTYQKIITNEDYDGSRARGAPPSPAPVVNITNRKGL